MDIIKGVYMSWLHTFVHVFTGLQHAGNKLINFCPEARAACKPTLAAWSPHEVDGARGVGAGARDVEGWVAQGSEGKALFLALRLSFCTDNGWCHC